MQRVLPVPMRGRRVRKHLQPARDGVLLSLSMLLRLSGGATVGTDEEKKKGRAHTAQSGRLTLPDERDKTSGGN